MNDTRREILLGYLTHALEDDEMRRVGIELDKHDEYRAELAKLQKETASIAEYAGFCNRTSSPPDGLAKRTCRAIWDKVDKQKSIAATYQADRGVHFELPETTDKKKISVDIFTQPPPADYDKIVVLKSSQPEPVSTNAVVCPASRTASDTPKATDKQLSSSPVKRSYVKLPQVRRQPNFDHSKGEWRLSNVLAIVSILVILGVVVSPVLQITANHVVKLYKQNMMRKIGQKNALFAELNAPVDHNPTDPDLDFRTGRDIGSFLSAFREVNLKQAILADPIPANRPYFGQPRFVNNTQTSYPTARVSYIPTVSGVSNTDSLLPLLDTKTVPESPGIPFTDWENSCASVLSDDCPASPNDCEFGVCEEPSVMYRDGHVLFRLKTK